MHNFKSSKTIKKNLWKELIKNFRNALDSWHNQLSKIIQFKLYEMNGWMGYFLVFVCVLLHFQRIKIWIFFQLRHNKKEEKVIQRGFLKKSLIKEKMIIPSSSLYIIIVRLTFNSFSFWLYFFSLFNHSRFLLHQNSFYEQKSHIFFALSYYSITNKESNWVENDFIYYFEAFFSLFHSHLTTHIFIIFY